MSFRNAVILSFCIAAGLEVFSGCAYNDKYVEIVLVDSGRQPESLLRAKTIYPPIPVMRQIPYTPRRKSHMTAWGKPRKSRSKGQRKVQSLQRCPTLPPRLCPQLRRRLLLRLCQRPCPRRNPRLPQRGRLGLQTRRSPRRTHWKRSTATSWLQKTPSTMNGKGR